jgi:DNA-directed RNA polymerase subunit RPC12/RpoP
MATDHKKRFTRWRKSLGSRSSFLVDQVFEIILPPLFEQGFEWANSISEFGALADSRADSIPLQRRSGLAWPTITIDFDQNKRAKFRVEFSELAELCFHRGQGDLLKIPRNEARIYDGSLYFLVIKHRTRSDDSRFGYDIFEYLSQPYRVDRLVRYVIAPKSLLAGEVRFAQHCMQEIQELIHSGIPREWETAEPGNIGRHLSLIDSDHLRRITYERAKVKPTTIGRPSTEIAKLAAAGNGTADRLMSIEPVAPDYPPNDAIDNEEDDEYENSAIDVAADPVLSAIDAELQAVSRRAKLLRNLFLALFCVAAIWYFQIPSSGSEWVRTLMFSTLLGAFLVQLFYWSGASRRVAEKHGLVCPSCGQPPPAPEVMSAAAKLRCPRCGAKLRSASLG